MPFFVLQNLFLFISATAGVPSRSTHFLSAVSSRIKRTYSFICPSENQPSKPNSKLYTPISTWIIRNYVCGILWWWCSARYNYAGIPSFTPSELSPQHSDESNDETPTGRVEREEESVGHTIDTYTQYSFTCCCSPYLCTTGGSH